MPTMLCIMILRQLSLLSEVKAVMTLETLTLHVAYFRTCPGHPHHPRHHLLPRRRHRLPRPTLHSQVGIVAIAKLLRQ